MVHLYHSIALPFSISWWLALAVVCHSFSADLPTNLVRHRRQQSRYNRSTKSPGSGRARHLPRRSVPSPSSRWNSSKESDVRTAAPPENPARRGPPSDLHPPTIRAIARALLVRAQNDPATRLRFADDGSMETWEVTFAAGKVAQQFAEEWMEEENLRPKENEEDEEAVQVVAGRVMAVLTRLEELEEELLKRCCDDRGDTQTADRGLDRFTALGVPEEELRVWRANEDDSKKRMGDAAAAIDAVCLFDKPLRHDRARSLLAMFLHEIEGPGLRRNSVVVPCMDVDFLSQDEWGLLFGEQEEEEELVSMKDGGIEDSEMAKAALDNSAEGASNNAGGNAADDEPARPSLHPVAIDAIEDALRLRAQNSTTSPFRLVNQQTEWFEVQYNIMSFTDRFLEKYTKTAASAAEGNNDESHNWREEELQTIGGRIVGVLMRLDDLEWEWNHRISTSPLAEADSPSMVPYDLWKTTLGLHAPHPERVEQMCFRTVDEALAEEKDFARTRAERMLALFLLNVEGPGLEASGSEVPGGSSPDFIEDAVQLKLMMPKPKKDD